MRVAIYTSIIKGYDILYNVESFKRDNVDFFNITDTNKDKKVVNGWNIIYVDKYIDESYCKYSRTNRYYKLHPNLFFKDYDINVYIDGNKKLFDLNMLLKYCKEIYDSKDIDLILPAHGERKKLSEEFKCIAELTKKEKLDVMDKQWLQYQKEGYDNNIRLTVNSVLIRKCNSSDLDNFLATWWNEVKTKSYRDQLSFCYAIWKTKFNKYRLIDVHKERLKMISNIYHNRYFDARK